MFFLVGKDFFILLLPQIFISKEGQMSFQNGFITTIGCACVGGACATIYERQVKNDDNSPYIPRTIGYAAGFLGVAMLLGVMVGSRTMLEALGHYQ